MAYQGNHYNYQVLVIFAILLGGILLLAMVAGAIYVVVTSMRADDDRKRLNRSRPQSQVWMPPAQQSYPGGFSSPAQAFASPSPQQYPPMPPPTQTPAFDQYNVRSVPASPSIQQYNVSQAPLVTQMAHESPYPAQYRQLQPEVVYTQGPATYVAQTPVEYSVSREPFRTSAI